MTAISLLPDPSPLGFKERIPHLFSRSYNPSQAHREALNILGQLQTGNADASSLVGRANRIIHTYQKSGALSKVIRLFDRLIAPYRQEDNRFVHPANRSGYKKWCEYGMPREVYVRFPEFCSWMEETRLLSQMKVTRNRAINTVHMVEGEPALLVNGRPMKWTDLKKTFNITEWKEHEEIFLTHATETTIYHEGAEPRPTVYTYLDNNFGLQPHHPYFSTKRQGAPLTPISTLSDEEYDKVLASAQKFARDGAEERPFILQIVSDYYDGPDTNFHQFIARRKHPWIRVIIGTDNPELGTKKGQVYEAGFNLKKQSRLPFAATQGWFRSPDRREYVPPQERVVTSIPISQAEARNVLNFTMDYHRSQEEIGFHFAYQNCTVFVRQACLAAGIEVPTQIRKMDLLARILPDWIIAIGRALKGAYQTSKSGFNFFFHRLPTCITNPLTRTSDAITNLFHTITSGLASFCLIPLRAALGELHGNGGRQLDAAAALGVREEGPVEAPLRNPPRWFTFFAEPINLPGVLQEWQRAKASTEIYNKPTILTIVPLNT